MGGICSSSSAASVAAKPETKAGQKVVIVTVAYAKGLKKMDLMSESDAFVEVECGKHKAKTVHVNNSKNPIWNKRFTFVFEEAEALPSEVTFTCWDHDSLSKNDYMGACAHRFDLGQPSRLLTLDLVNNKKGKGEVVGQLYAHVEARQVHAEDAALKYNYSHLLVVKVPEAKNLKKMDTFGSTDAYVEVSFGEQRFRTAVVHNNLNPKWHARCAFWITLPQQAQYVVRAAVHDRDTTTKDDMVGQAYVAVSSLLPKEAKGEEDVKYETSDSWHMLTSKSVEVDKDLAKGLKTDGSADEGLGQLHLNITLVPKEKVQADIVSRLFKEFDDDKSGSLSKSEIAALFSSMKLDLSPEQLVQYISQASATGQSSDALQEQQLIAILSHMETANEHFAQAIFSALTTDPEDVGAVLMEGVTSAPIADSSSGTIELIDRATGMVIKENMPGYLKMAMKSLFTGGLGRSVGLSSAMLKSFRALSVKRGKKWGAPESKSEIPAFVQLHNLNLDEVEKPVKDYASMNEFFARRLRDGARPIEGKADPAVAVSPADCRLTVWPTIMDATEIWIKGDKFTIENLLGPRAELASQFFDGSLVIARLAPQDYHRWHIPVDGRIVRKTDIDGELLTVNPIAINQNVNVYTMNKRAIVEIDSPTFGLVVLIPVGATMVGSIQYLKGEGPVTKGEEHGYFEFGGSTVLLLFQRGKINFDEDLVKNSKRKLETLVRVNTRIGAAPAAAAAAAPVSTGPAAPAPVA